MHYANTQAQRLQGEVQRLSQGARELLVRWRAERDQRRELEQKLEISRVGALALAVAQFEQHLPRQLRKNTLAVCYADSLAEFARMVRLVVRIQAWWRGTQVRRQWLRAHGAAGLGLPRASSGARAPAARPGHHVSSAALARAGPAPGDKKDVLGSLQQLVRCLAHATRDSRTLLQSQLVLRAVSADIAGKLKQQCQRVLAAAALDMQKLSGAVGAALAENVREMHDSEAQTRRTTTQEVGTAQSPS